MILSTRTGSSCSCCTGWLVGWLVDFAGARFPFLREEIDIGGYKVKSLANSKKRLLQLLRRRFVLYKSPPKRRAFVVAMIEEAYDNFWTRTYAKFQLLTNGIPP